MSRVTLGSWFRPAFVMLRSMRRLRGTPFDPFGYARVRRVERALVAEYVGAVDRVVDRIRESTDDDELRLAVQILDLPDMVRGYEHIKLDNVDRYRGRLTELTAALGPQRSHAPAPPPTR